MSLPPCRHKAMDLLARRPHFRAELAAKLLRRGYEEAEVESTLDRLASDGLLDDARTAADFVAHKLGREPLGRRRLFAELARRGAPAEAARAAVDAALPDDDLALALAAAERWLARRAGAAPAALARHLERRGFSRRAIVAVLDTMAVPFADADPDD